MDQLRFTVPEILSLIGLSQCVYLLVYMLFRAGDLWRALLPLAYFLMLGAAFFLDFGQRYIGSIVPYYNDFSWAAWFMGPPLSVLLIIQVAQITRIPAFFNFWVLLLVPVAYGAARIITLKMGACTALPGCTVFQEWLSIAGLVAGALSMLTIWANRGLMEGLHAEKAGKDRYWLTLTLVFVNLFFMAAILLGLSPLLAVEDAQIVRSCLGLALVYLAGTSLFRIYPQALVLVERGHKSMNEEETALARKIETLIDLEKVYQEPGYNRTDLARELQTPEASVSRVINTHFGKSLPQLLNEKRVEDAKRMLAETAAPIKVVAGDVGFNSMASFNRIFRELTGMTPTDFRSHSTHATAKE